MTSIESHSAYQYLSALQRLGGSFDQTDQRKSGALPPSWGSGDMEHFELGNGLELSITRYQMNRAMEIAVGLDRPTFSFGCILEGQSELTTTGERKKSITARAGASLSFWSHRQGFVFNVPAKTRLCSVVVSVTPEFLTLRCSGRNSGIPLELERALSRSDFAPSFNVRQLSPIAMSASQHILHSCDGDPLRTFLLESHALTLLREQLIALCQSSATTNARFYTKRDELEKLHEVRRMLLIHPERSPRLQELAHHVCMNECDLKRGFRAVFGTTIYGLLRKRRMEVADQLLTSRQMNIAQISEAVGYKSPSRFAVAFRQHFGVSPKRRQTN